MVKSAFLVAGIALLLLLPSINGFSQHSRLAPSIKVETDTFRILVNDSVRARKWLTTYLPHVQLKRDRVDNVYLLSGVKTRDLNTILNIPEVRYIEPVLRKPRPEGNVPGMDLSVNGLSAVRDAYPSVAGSGLRASVKETPFNRDDIDLKDRVVGYETIPEQYDQHATMMATIIAGAGNSAPENRGVAFQSGVAYADFNNLMPEPTSVLIDDAINVQNHSYGVGVENFYGIEAFAYDDQCVSYPSIIHVFSAGNEGTSDGMVNGHGGISGYANLTGQFKNAKNVIVVGGTNRDLTIVDASSRGPAADGRVKPEVVAFGNGGTSEAAATVSGICLVAQDAYKQTYNSLPPSSLIRAALVNSANDGGRPNVDYEYGFGHADALGLINTIAEGRFFQGSVDYQATESFVIQVPQGIYRLKISLAWTDPGGGPGIGTALVNDLDLSVVDNAENKEYKPWTLSVYPHVDSLRKMATRKVDRVNNVEQVTIDLPTEGNYTIHVSGYNVPAGPQAFSIAYEMEGGFSWLSPATSYALPAAKEVDLRWNWVGDDGPASIQWRLKDAEAWTDIAEVALSHSNVRWKTPNLNDIIEVRIVDADDVLWTGALTVSEVPDVEVAYHCEDNVMFLWPSLAVTEYELYKLNGGFLEPYAVTGDTSFVINTEEEASQHFAVAPRVGGNRGVRSRAITYGFGNNYCYLVSFLAREVVTDSVYLDVVMGTPIGLLSVFVERESAQGFSVIAEYGPDVSSFSYYDPDPAPGRNRYRIRIVRTQGPDIFSDIEEVWFTRDHDIDWYPNPVLQGQPLNLVVSDDPALVRIYDAIGRIVRERSEDGEIKTIDTHGLKPGFYVMKVHIGSGEEKTVRFIIR